MSTGPHIICDVKASDFVATPVDVVTDDTSQVGIQDVYSLRVCELSQLGKILVPRTGLDLVQYKYCESHTLSLVNHWQGPDFWHVIGDNLSLLAAIKDICRWLGLVILREWVREGVCWFVRDIGSFRWHWLSRWWHWALLISR